MSLLTRQTLGKATVSLHPLKGLVLVEDRGWGTTEEESKSHSRKQLRLLQSDGNVLHKHPCETVYEKFEELDPCCLRCCDTR